VDLFSYEDEDLLEERLKPYWTGLLRLGFEVKLSLSKEERLLTARPSGLYSSTLVHGFKT